VSLRKRIKHLRGPFAGGAGYWRNAISALIRSLAVFIPAFAFARIIPTTYGDLAFNGWATAIQFASYVSILEFGISAITSKYIAEGKANLDSNDLKTTYIAAKQSARWFGVGGVAIAVAGVVLIPFVIRGMPTNILRTSQVVTAIIACSSVVSLATSSAPGVLVGLQRTEILAIIGVITRCLAVAFAGLAIHLTAPLAVVAALYSSTIVLGAVATERIAHKHVDQLSALFLDSSPSGPALKYRSGVASHAESETAALRIAASGRRRDILSACRSMSSWTAGSVLVGGLDLVIVGWFDSKKVGPYSSGLLFATGLAAVCSGIMNPLLPRFAGLSANGSFRQLRSELKRFTIVLFAALVAIGIVFQIAARPFLQFYQGENLGRFSATYAVVIVWATCVRQTGAPFAYALIATGDQRLVTLSPLAEGLVNLVASVVLASRYGAVGVAYGTLIGSVVSVALHAFYNYPRTVIFRERNAHAS
jgi:O-antigen/teichoic acid export membrane protein